MHRACVAIALWSAAACSGRALVAPEPPRDFSHEAETFAPEPAGTIVAPLTLDTDGALRALEQEVPLKFGNIRKRLPVAGSGRKFFAYEVRREPFTAAFRGDTILLSSIIHYRGQGWYNPPIGPELNGECGTGAAPPRARLTLRIVPRLDENWQLRVRTGVAGVVKLTDTDRDQCKVSFLNVDVTGLVLGAARGALRGELPSVERKLAGLDLKTPLGKIWADLQRPIRITDSLWLVLAPEAVQLGGVRGDRGVISAQLGIRAAPKILTGSRPRVAPVPLPPLAQAPGDAGFSVLVEGSFDYGVMGEELSRRLRGRTVNAAGGELIVRHLEVIALGGGRLGLGLDFGGTARGRLWFRGTPSYDAATGMITVPDLDFDASSAGVLVRGVAWLQGSSIRDSLRKQAQVPAAPLLERLRALATREMNRSLAKGVTLRAAITGAEPAGIAARANALVLRVRASGSARLDLGPELFGPGPGGP